MMFNFIYFVLCCVIATPLLPMAPHEPSTRSTDFASPAELLSELSIFGFSLLSPKDQQDKIEQISNKLAAEDVNVGSLAAAGETKEDVRRKAFAMLFNKAPVVTRVHLFKEFTQLQAQETEEDFKLRRFTDLESFKQLQFSSQEDIVEFIQDAVFRDLVDDVSNTFEMREDVSNTFEMSDVGVPGVSGNGFGMSDVGVSNTFEMREDVSNTGDSVSGNVAGITSRKRFRRRIVGVGIESAGVEISDSNVGFHYFGNTTSSPVREPLLEFFKMSTPDLRGPRGATATQVGGQGAITQGGQGTSQHRSRMIC